jgi:hypothetical protein
MFQWLSFARELLGRAWNTLFFSMGTTVLAVSFGLVRFGYQMVRIWCQRGWRVMVRRFKASLKDSAGAALILWIVLFSWHLFWTVPREIRTQAALALPQKTPAPRAPDLPTPAWHLSSDQRANLKKLLGNRCSLLVATQFGFKEINANPLFVVVQDNHDANAINIRNDLKSEFQNSKCGDHAVFTDEMASWRGSGIDEEGFPGMEIYSGYTSATARVAKNIGDALKIPVSTMPPQPNTGGYYQGMILLIGSKPGGPP